MCSPSKPALSQIEHFLDFDGHLGHVSDRMSVDLGLPLRWEEHAIANGEQGTVFVASILDDKKIIRVGQRHFEIQAQTFSHSKKSFLLGGGGNKGVHLLCALGICISADHREPA